MGECGFLIAGLNTILYIQRKMLLRIQIQVWTVKQIINLQFKTALAPFSYIANRNTAVDVL